MNSGQISFPFLSHLSLLLACSSVPVLVLVLASLNRSLSSTLRRNLRRLPLPKERQPAKALTRRHVKARKYWIDIGDAFARTWSDRLGWLA
jgi:hypothetical protein